MVIGVMGVAGAGKTTIGRLLASELGWEFIEADHYHSPDNVRKMASGRPLTDDDRLPWLDHLRGALQELTTAGRNVVMACSALKRSYRQRLSTGSEPIVWVYLMAKRDLVVRRLAERRGHFMPAQLLDSQLETLQEPSEVVRVNAGDLPDVIVAQIRRTLEV